MFVPILTYKKKFLIIENDGPLLNETLNIRDLGRQFRIILQLSSFEFQFFFCII